MKTRNNVQKAITKSFAVVISLVLISITVNAQDFWETVFENNSFRQIALAMADNSEASPASADATTNANTFAALLEVEVEETLELEDWMINETNFYSSLTMETEVENALEIEEWMTNENLFDVSTLYMEVETEAALEVEGWMQNQDFFIVKTVEVTIEIENGLELESWMTDNNIWKI